MKITAISAQVKDPNRVNVSVEGKYRFSLDVFQVGELGLKIGRDYSEQELEQLEEESQYGKLYGRALEYCLVRPRSVREMRDYLWKKTRPSKHRAQKTGTIVERQGVSKEVADRVLARLIEKKYLDDEKFARFWLDNRFMKKGASLRRLRLELAQKGVEKEIVERVIAENIRSDEEELQKIIAKKRYRYPDQQKFMQYLARQGFSFDDIKAALDSDD